MAFENVIREINKQRLFLSMETFQKRLKSGETEGFFAKRVEIKCGENK